MPSATSFVIKRNRKVEVGESYDESHKYNYEPPCWSIWIENLYHEEYSRSAQIVAYQHYEE